MESNCNYSKIALSRDFNRNVQASPEERLTHFLSKDGKINLTAIFQGLSDAGFSRSDPRLKDAFQKIEKSQSAATIIDNDVYLDAKTFAKCISESADIFVKAFTSDLVMPEFHRFCSEIEDIYNLCKNNFGGKVADYIPQLSRFSAENWGVSVCSVDGQRFNLGKVSCPFPIESCCKPINYCLALDDKSGIEVHKFIGREPSGESFNQIKLDHSQKPHNPMINTGAIVCASLLKTTERPADRFEYAMSMYRRLAGQGRVGFNNSVFLSERETADRNFALGHYLKENGCFPDESSLQETMDLYFQLCSVEVTCESAATIAATLANGGICPTTRDKVVEGWTVRNTLSLMHSCGMYDYSGQFAFNVGLPAKSGVSGIVLLVIPNLCGVCLWSPPLDEYGNSVRGIQFCEELVRRFNFHEYDCDKVSSVFREDPRTRHTENQARAVTTLHFAASNGDITSLRRSHMLGRNLSIADYDGRTALHLASAEGNLECVRFLVEVGKVNPAPKDRFGNTPLKDAKMFNREPVVQFLLKHTKE